MASTSAPGGYARYIGRVGGLAVALGIGVAIGQGAATASADSGDTSTTDPGQRVAADVQKVTKKLQNGLRDTGSQIRKAATDAGDRVRTATSSAVRDLERLERKGATAVKQLDTTKLDTAKKAKRLIDSPDGSAAAKTAPSLGDIDLGQVGLGQVDLGQVADVVTTQLRNAPHNIVHEVESTVTETAPAVLRNWTKRVDALTHDGPLNLPESLSLQTLLGLADPKAVPSPSTPQGDETLKTDEQLAAERDVDMITSTLIVEAAKYVIKAVWYVNALQNYSQVGGPDKTNMDQLDQAVDEFANQAAIESMLLNPMDTKLLQQVMPPHVWSDGAGGFIAGPGTRIWYDNPDTTYRFAAVNASSEYLIHGTYTPGAEPTDTNFSVLTGLNGQTAENLSWDQIEKNPDGTFDITIGSDPAKRGTTNYLYMPADATLVTTRNTRTDSVSQQNMELIITKTSGPPNSLFAQLGGYVFPGIGPAVTQNEDLIKLVSVIPPVELPLVVRAGETALLMMIMGIMKETEYMQVATVVPETGQQRAPNTFTDPQYNAQFLSTQRQSSGYFQLADDDVLELTITPGDSGYFVVPVTNDWTITGDPSSSLNSGHAVDNGDGTYTVYVSKADNPGATNWVSTGGLNQGTIAIRFQKVGTGQQPKVSSRVIKLSDVPVAV